MSCDSRWPRPFPSLSAPRRPGLFRRSLGPMGKSDLPRSCIRGPNAAFPPRSGEVIPGHPGSFRFGLPADPYLGAVRVLSHAAAVGTRGRAGPRRRSLPFYPLAADRARMPRRAGRVDSTPTSPGLRCGVVAELVEMITGTSCGLVQRIVMVVQPPALPNNHPPATGKTKR